VGPSPRHIFTHEAMKVASETWQRSPQTLPAAGSYIQPCICNNYYKLYPNIKLEINEKTFSRNTYQEIFKLCIR